MARRPVTGVQVKDDFTITFELKEPYANWDQVALAEMNVLPAHIYKSINPADLKEDDGPAWFQAGESDRLGTIQVRSRRKGKVR